MASLPDPGNDASPIDVDPTGIEWKNLEYLKDDLSSTVLITADDFNKLVFSSEDKVPPSDAISFAKFLRHFTTDKQYRAARTKFLRTTQPTSQLALFSTLCNLIVDRLGIFADHTLPNKRIRFVRDCGQGKRLQDMFVLGVADSRVKGKGIDIEREFGFDHAPSEACPSSAFLEESRQPGFCLNGRTLARSQIDGHVPFMIGRASDNVAQTFRTTEVETRPMTRNRKRMLEGSGTDEPPLKKPKNTSTCSPCTLVQSVSDVTSKASEENGQAADTKKLVHAMQLKNLSYVLDNLRCNSCLQSHSIGMVLDGTEVQLTYHDHSVILLALPISVDKDEVHFLATVYYLRGLSRAERGFVPPVMHPPDVDKLAECCPSVIPKWINTYPDEELVLGSENNANVYILKECISASLNYMTDKSTVVFHATLKNVPNATPRVVKFSFPSTKYASEGALLYTALQIAKKNPSKWAWVEHVLPTLRYCIDIPLNKDVGHPQEAIMAFLEGSDFVYTERVLRISSHDKLEPLTSVREELQYAKVFCDVLQGHKWLFDHPKILHRDISEQNIMVRRIGDVVFGVLTDLDIALELSKPEADKNTMATGRYMARDCIITPVHYYRQDLEALFYVILLYCCRRNLKGETISSTYDDWYHGPVHEVRYAKTTLYEDDWFCPPVTPDFKHFETPLIHMHDMFEVYYYRFAKDGYLAEFDHESGFGAVTYGKFLDCLKVFDGEALTVHYPTESVPAK